MPAVVITKLRGMTDDLAAKLQAKGYKDSDDLLPDVRTPKQRKELAEETGVELEVIRELANRADLARISGIGAAYGDLLEHSGVDTVVALARRIPANLHAKMLEVNGEKKITQNPPAPEAVESWVNQAKALDRALEY